MSSSSLVTGAAPLGCMGLRSQDIGQQARFLALRCPFFPPESRQHELTAALWRFPAGAGKTVAVTFLQPVNRKTASWTAAIKIPDHRTVSPQSLARMPRSGMSLLIPNSPIPDSARKCEDSEPRLEDGANSRGPRPHLGHQRWVARSLRVIQKVFVPRSLGVR
jgi:hypothetical protein